MWDSSANILTTVKSRRPRNCGLIPSKGKRKGPKSHMAYPAFSQYTPQGLSQMIKHSGRENKDVPLSSASLRRNGHTSTFLKESSDRAGDNFTFYRNEQFILHNLLLLPQFILTHFSTHLSRTLSIQAIQSKWRDKVSLLHKMAGVIRFLCVFR